MRAHHAIAVVAVILIGVGLKLIFFTAPTAEAVAFSVKSASVDVSGSHQNAKNLSGGEIPRRATHLRG